MTARFLRGHLVSPQKTSFPFFASRRRQREESCNSPVYELLTETGPYPDHQGYNIRVLASPFLD
jgi:hypothetical protein